MLSSGRTWSSLFFVVLASTVVPVTSAQSLSSLLKTLQQASSSDTASIFKSFAETIQGQLPSGTQVENADGKVVLYRTAWCGYCKKAAAYMRQKSIPFLERDIEANAVYKAEYAKLGGNGSVPFIVFGQKTIYGFSESTFDKNYSDFQVAMVATPPAKGGGPAR